MSYLISITISFALGFLGINLLRAKNSIDPLLHVIAAFGLGMAASAHIAFYSLLILGKYNQVFICLTHAAAFGLLLWGNALAFHAKKELMIPELPKNHNLWLALGLLGLLLFPLCREAGFHPFGGWDAWACWNLKAKFIYLGADHWGNMFDPLLWRSNNQYPFLLPLINAWGWSFGPDPSTATPMANTILFTFLTALLLFWGIYRSIRSILAVIPPLLLFTIPFVNTLSISQYSDIVMGFYLLATLICLVSARQEDNAGLTLIAGACCGIMTFTKTEGMLAGFLMAGLGSIYLWKTNPKKEYSWPLAWTFLAAFMVCAFPTIFFQWFWAPENASFINGLTSSEAPSTWTRFKIIVMFLCAEVFSQKWNGLWVLLTCGLLLANTKSFKNGLGIVPLFLILYLGCAFTYYYVNTHFEIIWWLSMTLNRVLYTVLPAVVWWVFYALVGEKIKYVDDTD